MADPTPPDEQDGDARDGRVDYSNRDYHAPTGYQAPDFVSKWAASSTDPAADEVDAALTEDRLEAPESSYSSQSSYATQSFYSSTSSYATTAPASTSTPTPRPGAADDTVEPVDIPAEEPRLDDDTTADTADTAGAETTSDADNTADSTATTPLTPFDALRSRLADSERAAEEQATADAAARAQDEEDRLEAERRAAARAEADADRAELARAETQRAEVAAAEANREFERARERVEQSSASADPTPQERFAKRLEQDVQRQRRHTKPLAATPAAANVGGQLRTAGLFAAVVALALAYWIPGLAAVAAVLALALGIAGTRFAGPGRGRSVGTIVLAAIAIVMLIAFAVVKNLPATPTTDGSGDTTTGGGTTSGPLTFTGTDDEVLEFALPGGAGAPAVVDVTFEGDLFDLEEVPVDDDDYGATLVTLYDSGSHSTVMNVGYDPVKGLEIEAEGTWTIVVRAADTVPIMTGPVSGEGGTVLRYSGEAGIMSLTAPRPITVSVEAADRGMYWSMSEDGLLSMSKEWEAGNYLVLVESDGPWTLEILPPAPTDAPTTAPPADAPTEAPGETPPAVEEPPVDAPVDPPVEEEAPVEGDGTGE